MVGVLVVGFIANLLIRPEDRRALGPAFDRAVEALRYGTIAINAWTALGFLTAAAPWGAFPGNTVGDDTAEARRRADHAASLLRVDVEAAVPA